MLKELATVIKSLGQDPNDEHLLHHILSKVDVDGNEKMEFGEFLKQMKVRFTVQVIEINLQA